MNRSRIHRLGDLQLQILQILWAQGQATVAAVLQALPAGPALAYTTVATMLRKMEARGLVEHRVADRTFVYQAKVRQEEVSGGLTTHLLDRLFAGSVTDLVHHLLTERQVSAQELGRLARLVAQHRKAP
jgi:predicted transcriptional regulator